MALSVVQGQQGFVSYGQGPGTVTTGAINTTTGNTFLLFMGHYTDGALAGASPPTSDNKSNTYAWAQVSGAGSPISLIEYAGYPGGGVRPAICYAGNGGTGHTASSTFTAGEEATMFIVELAGGVTKIQDHQQQTSASNTTHASPTATATGEAIAIATIWGLAWDTALSVDNGFTLDPSLHYQGSGNSIQGAVAYKYLPAGGSASCTWTIAGAQEAIVTMTVLQGASTSSVSGTEAPTQPSQTGANPFQNLNYIAANETAASAQQYAEVLEVAIPTWVATGTFGDGTTGSTQFPLPAGIVKGDILEAFCEAANQTVTNSATGGGVWTQATSSPQGTGTAGGTSATSLTRFWSRYDGVQTAPSFQCSGGNHVNGCIAAFRGCVPYGDPHHVNTGGVKATSSTTTSIPGSTTTKPNCLVVAVVSRMDDSNAAHYSAWTNANLTNVTEIADGGGTGGNGGGIGACCGGLASAGTYGATTATNATTTTNAYMTFALLGVEAGTASVTHAEQSPGAPSSTATLDGSGSVAASVSGSQTTSEPTETETLQTPNTVVTASTATQPTQTGTSLQTNTVATGEATSPATQTGTLQQTASVSGASTTAQPTEAATALQASTVAGTEAPAAPGQTETLTAQFVQGTQGTTAPSETAIVFQGSNVSGVEATTQPGQTETLSNQGISGTQTPAQPTETATQTQPNTVTGASIATAPTESGTALQTNTVTGAATTTEPHQTGVAAQASIVVTAETTTPPAQLETLAQGAGIVGVSTATQASEITGITQPSKVTGAQVASQPIETLTALQTSSVVAQQATQQPIELETLQQGSLVSTFQAPDEPDELGGALQASYVSGFSFTEQPSQLLQLQATSRVDGSQNTSIAIELLQITTYSPNLVSAVQATTHPSEFCTITPQLVLVGVRMSQLPMLERAPMRSRMTNP